MQKYYFNYLLFYFIEEKHTTVNIEKKNEYLPHWMKKL
jgi:hypothetical protein